MEQKGSEEGWEKGVEVKREGWEARGWSKGESGGRGNRVSGVGGVTGSGGGNRE